MLTVKVAPALNNEEAVHITAAHGGHCMTCVHYDPHEVDYLIAQLQLAVAELRRRQNRTQPE